MDPETTKVLESIRKMLAESGRLVAPANTKSPYEQFDKELKAFDLKKTKKRKVARSKNLPSVGGRSAGTRDEVAMRTISFPYIDSVMLVDESLKVAHHWAYSNTDKSALNTGDITKSEIKSLMKRFPRFCEGLLVTTFDTTLYKMRSDIWLVRTIEEAYDAVFGECIKPVCAARLRRRYDLELGAMDCFPHSVKRFLSHKYSSIIDLLPQLCIELLLAINRVTDTMDKVVAHRPIDGKSISHAGRVMLFAQFLSEEYDVDKVAAYLHTRDVVQEVAGVKFRDIAVHVVNPVVSHDEHGIEQEIERKKKAGQALLAGHPFLDSTTLLSPTTSTLDSRRSQSSSQLISRPISSTGDPVEAIDAAKICPVKLPYTLRLLRDCTMPDTPLLAIDLRTLTIICQRLAPQSQSTMRRYLYRKCMMWTEALMNMQTSMFKLLLHLEDPTVFDECCFNGIEIDGMAVIPAHVVIWMVVTEIGMNKSGEVTKPDAEVGDHSEGLTSTEVGISVLNSLYENNRAKVHAADDDLARAELELSQSKARVLMLEKKKRRLERKWKEYVPDHSLTGLLAAKAAEGKGYDLADIAALRTELAEAEADKCGREATCRRLKKKRAQLLASIESAWESTIAGKVTPKLTTLRTSRKPQNTDGNSRWRDVVVSKILDAITSNAIASENVRESRQQFDKVLGGQRTGDPEVDKAYMYPHDVVKKPGDVCTDDDSEFSSTVGAESSIVIATAYDALEGSSARVLIPEEIYAPSQSGGGGITDITAQMAALENDARKLAAIGRVHDVDTMAPADVLHSPLSKGIDFLAASGDLDQIRLQLASREAESFVDSIIKKHGLDDDNYMENIERDLSELRAQVVESETAKDMRDDLEPSTTASKEVIFTEEDYEAITAEIELDDLQDEFAAGTLTVEEVPAAASVEIVSAEEVIIRSIPLPSSMAEIPEFEVYEHVSAEAAGTVDRMFHVIQKSNMLRAIAQWHYFVNVEKMLKRHRKHWCSQKCRAVILRLGVYAIESKATKRRSTLIVQCAARVFLANKRVQRVIKANEARQDALRSGIQYIEKIHMRYALRAFMENTTKRQNLRERKNRVQYARIAPYFKDWQKAHKIVRLSYALRQFVARRKAYRQRCRRVRLAEFNDGYPVMCRLQNMRSVLRHWQLLRSCSVMFRLIYIYANKTKVTRRWARWKNTTKEYLTFRRDAATKMAATARMYISRNRYGNFYTVRKGVISLQCVVRGRIAQTVVAHARRQHFAAIEIQRIARGFGYRVNMRANRITDIHNAAISDNYDRLFYYLERYYNLTFQLDEQGNSALHNATQNASKRCAKLLLRYHHDPTLVNPSGFSPLHLLITSATPYRDSMFEYMLSLVGFDEFQRTGDSKTALILAAEYGRSKIVSVLLEREHNPNDVDGYGSTALQYACLYGFEPIVRYLLEANADVNIPGYEGMYPLHDVMSSGSVPILNMLLESGAIVDVQEPSNGYTPLMLACRNGFDEIVDLLLLQEPDVSVRDYTQCTVAHHVVHSDSLHIANSLREANCDFDVVDVEGNSPLHYAAQLGAVHCMEEFLHSLVSPSLQNLQGNQPSHIAAQYNQVGCLKALLLYDEHIGRMNFKHMTPLGMAKFHMTKEAQLFLEEHFRKIDGPGIRNEDGDVWWDKELDKQLSDWRVVVDECNHRHYINDRTGEVTLDAPKMKLRKVEKVAMYAQVPMQMKVLVQEEESTMNRHEYDMEFKQIQNDIAESIRLYDAATMIEKTARRKLAYMKVHRLLEAKQRMDVLARFFVRAVDTVIKWKLLIRSRKVARIQSLFRGYSMRCHFYYWDGTYEYLWYELQKRRLARTVWTLWKNFKLHQMQTTFQVAANAPTLITEWEPILDQVGYPIRTVGIIEEYLYPGTHNIYFYRNFETGKISFDKPKELISKDRKDFIARTMLREQGFTPAELWLALKIQALWQGHKVRRMYEFIVRATAICVNAESNYLKFPDSDRNLFNYTLYCHVVLNDYNRARPLYLENLRRMQYKGPDVAQILYAYSIFAFVTHDQDIDECNMMIYRAREAEQQQYNYIRKQKHRAKSLEQKGEDDGNPYVDIPVTRGKSFELANVGFFRYMCNMKNNSDGFHNYAVCQFLVYEDFSTAFDAFMGAFKSDPMNKRLRKNYDAMLEHFFGSNQNMKDEVVNKRMQFLAAKDHKEKMEQKERIELAARKTAAIKRIQKWYRHYRGLRDFYSFVARLRRKKQRD